MDPKTAPRASMAPDVGAAHDDGRIIDALGGTAAVARMCRVRPQAVTQWRRAGIPQARRMYLELRFPSVFARSSAEAKRRAA